jgi:uncharacterized protein (DUF983 family)
MLETRQRTRWSHGRLGGLRRLCLRRVLHKRCPQCGAGALFAGYARLHERCEVCGLVYRRERGAELGSMYLLATASQLFAALIFFAFAFWTDWGSAVSILIGLPLVVAFCYLVLPWSMGIWTAVDYLTDVGNREWWAQPRP